MGLDPISYVLGWVMTLYIEGMIVFVITLVGIVYSSYNLDLAWVALNYILYILAVTHQTFLLTTFFDSPKLAGEFGSFI
jgi:hypothetical protein